MRPIILPLFLGACTSVVPATLHELSGVTPLNADPAVISVSVEIPEGLSFMPDSALVLLRAERKDTDQVSEEQYILEQLVSGDTHIFQIAPRDYTRMRAQQSLISTWKTDAGDDVKGSLSVTFAGCAIGEGPDLDNTITIGIRTYDAGPYLTLVRDAPVDTVLQRTELDIHQPCPDIGVQSVQQQ